jgi:hypothetical protein
MSVLQYELDATSSLLDFAMPNLVRLRAEVDLLTAQARQLERELAASRAETEAARTTLDARTAEHSRAVEATRAELDARVAEHALTMDAARAELDARTAEYARAMEAARADLNGCTAEHARALETTRAALDATRAELDERALDHARACAEWNDAKQAMDAAHRHFMQRVYVHRLQPVLTAVRKAKVRELTVYGAGDVGRAMIAACRANGITVVRVVDGNSALWGQTIDGVPVASVDACLGDHSPAVALASFLHSAAMRKDLRAVLRGRTARIFAPARWVI